MPSLALSMIVKNGMPHLEATLAAIAPYLDGYLVLDTGSTEEHAPPPSTRRALVSLGLLLVSLVAVVGLAKTLTPALEATLQSAQPALTVESFPACARPRLPPYG